MAWREDPAQDDVSLLAAMAEGSERALRAFYERHQAGIYRFALRRLDSEADAAEVLNEVMLEVWRNAGRFEGRSRPSTWVLGIAHHKTMDCLRRRGRAAADPLDDAPPLADDAPALADAVTGAEDADHVRRCVEKLPEGQRQVVHLAFFEDLAYPEVARILEIPEGTVKTRMYHAKAALQRCLQRLARGMGLD